MRRSLAWRAVLALGCILLAAAPALADQSLSLTLGYFALRGEDARTAGDVLVENRSFLAFNLKDFNSASFGGEWLVGLGDYVEAGVGLGYYRRTVPSVYDGFVSGDGSEIEQDLKFRIIPITATVRFLPLGRRGLVQPYIGGGLGLYRWRYSETGEFVDFTDLSIFRDRFVAEGTDAGPVVLGGVRLAVGSRVTTGGEIRYDSARGTLGEGFLTDTIDLGGFSFLATVNLKF